MRWLCRRCDPKRVGHVEFEQSREVWLGSDWQGKSIWSEPRLLRGEGDTADWRGEGAPPGEEAFKPVGPSVFKLPLAQLPTDPEGLRRAIEGAIQAPDPSPSTRIFELMQAAEAILGISNAPADLRAAAYGMLARIDGARALGETRDSEGRTGQAIQISDGGERRFTFVVDPGTGTLLESTVDYGQGPHTVATYLTSARVPAMGERP